MEENKILTYAELKDFCNGLSEDQLKQTVKIWLCDNESPSDVNFAEELGQDTYYFPELEYSCNKLDFNPKDNLDDDNQPLYATLEEALEKEEHYVTPANRVYLHSIDG